MPTPPRPSAAEYLSFLARDVGRYVDLLRDADLAATVPPCPGWTLTDLTVHLGTVHRWAADRVRTGQPAPRADGLAVDGDLLVWFAEGASELVRILSDADPRRPCWTFGPPSTVEFWLRRQAQETSVHLWDAGASQGLDIGLDERLAADGIAEVAELFVPRQRELGRQGAMPVTLRLETEGGTVVIPADDAGAPVATLQGSASRLLLTLWGRSPLDPIAVDGDVEAVKAALAAHLTS